MEAWLCKNSDLNKPQCKSEDNQIYISAIFNGVRKTPYKIDIGDVMMDTNGDLDYLDAKSFDKYWKPLDN